MSVDLKHPLVERATDAIIESERTKFPMQRFVARRFAQAALDAFHAEEIVDLLKRLTAPYTGDPDGEPLEAILDDAADLLAKLDGKPSGGAV